MGKDSEAKMAILSLSCFVELEPEIYQQKQPSYYAVSLL
jgi:hypothetical protein